MSITQLNKISKRKIIAPKRDTIPFPRSMLYGNFYNNHAQIKPLRPSLRGFANTPYVNRAIQCIKNPILELEWEIKPLDNVKSNAELDKQIETITNCFHHPNLDDSFRTLLDQVLLDFLTFGGGVIEQQMGRDEIRPLWMWPVDAQSIQIFADWNGKPTQARYLQTIGFSNVGLETEGRMLRNDEIIYIKDNPNTASPFGAGRVEIAYNAIRRVLAAEAYAGNTASNASPDNLIFLGNVSKDEKESFREFWRNYVEGRGETPILGGDATSKPEILKLHGGNDDALFLKWQEFLIRAIATAFGLTPRKLGIERDVNRSTAEVSSDEDWDLTIKPIAKSFASYLTRNAIHSKLGCYNLQFEFVGLDREDEESTAKIFETRYKNNSITPNEFREQRGETRIENKFADMLFVDTQVAMEAARGSKQIDDPNLSSNPKAQSNTDPTNSKLSNLKETTPVKK